jgi:hypothetical protein
MKKSSLTIIANEEIAASDRKRLRIANVDVCLPHDLAEPHVKMSRITAAATDEVPGIDQQLNSSAGRSSEKSVAAVVQLQHVGPQSSTSSVHDTLPNHPFPSSSLTNTGQNFLSISLPTFLPKDAIAAPKKVVRLPPKHHGLPGNG